MNAMYMNAPYRHPLCSAKSLRSSSSIVMAALIRSVVADNSHAPQGEGVGSVLRRTDLCICALCCGGVRSGCYDMLLVNDADRPLVSQYLPR